jgi:hypothetical protein
MNRYTKAVLRAPPSAGGLAEREHRLAQNFSLRYAGQFRSALPARPAVNQRSNLPYVSRSPIYPHHSVHVQYRRWMEHMKIVQHDERVVRFSSFINQKSQDIETIRRVGYCVFPQNPSGFRIAICLESQMTVLNHPAPGDKYSSPVPQADIKPRNWLAEPFIAFK